MQVNQAHSILTFSEDLTMEIFSYFSVEELAGKVSSVCKRFNHVAQADKLWKALTIRQFGDPDNYQSIVSSTIWKKIYLELQELATTPFGDWKANCIKLLVGNKRKASKNKSASPCIGQ